MPENPFMTIDNTTCYDTSRTPPGKHTMWNFVRAPVFLSGKSWRHDDNEESSGDGHNDECSDFELHCQTIFAPDFERVGNI